MNENCSWDYLKDLSKDEIIEFCRRELFMRAPEKRKVDFFKWDITARKLQKQMDKHLSDKSDINLAQQIDDLGREFNNETDTDKKLNILGKRELLFKKLNSHHKEWERINKLMEKNDKIINRLNENDRL